MLFREFAFGKTEVHIKDRCYITQKRQSNCYLRAWLRNLITCRHETAHILSTATAQPIMTFSTDGINGNSISTTTTTTIIITAASAARIL